MAPISTDPEKDWKALFAKGFVQHTGPVPNNFPEYAGQTVRNIPNVLSNTWDLGKRLGFFVGNLTPMASFEQRLSQLPGVLSGTNPSPGNPELENLQRAGQQVGQEITNLGGFATQFSKDPKGTILSMISQDPVGSYFALKSVLGGVKNVGKMAKVGEAAKAAETALPEVPPAQPSLPGLVNGRGLSGLTPEEAQAVAEARTAGPTTMPTEGAQPAYPRLVRLPGTIGKTKAGISKTLLPESWRTVEPYSSELPSTKSSITPMLPTELQKFQLASNPEAAPSAMKAVTPEGIVQEFQAPRAKAISPEAAAVKSLINVHGDTLKEMGMTPDTWENLARGNNFAGKSKVEMYNLSKGATAAISNAISAAASNARNVNIGDMVTELNRMLKESPLKGEERSAAQAIIDNMQSRATGILRDTTDGNNVLSTQKKLASLLRGSSDPRIQALSNSINDMFSGKILDAVENTPDAQTVLQTIKDPQVIGTLRKAGMNKLANDLEAAQNIQQFRGAIKDVTQFSRAYELDQIAGPSRAGVGTALVRGTAALIGTAVGTVVPGVGPGLGFVAGAQMEPMFEAMGQTNKGKFIGNVARAMGSTQRAAGALNAAAPVIGPPAAGLAAIERQVRGGLPTTPPATPSATPVPTPTPTLGQPAVTQTQPGTFQSQVLNLSATRGPDGMPLVMTKADYDAQKKNFADQLNAAQGNEFMKAKIKEQEQAVDAKFATSKPLLDKQQETLAASIIADEALRMIGNSPLDWATAIKQVQEGRKIADEKYRNLYQGLLNLEDAAGLSKGSLTGPMLPGVLRSAITEAMQKVLTNYQSMLQTNTGIQPTTPIQPAVPQYPTAPIAPPSGRGGVQGTSHFQMPGGGGAGLPPLPGRKYLPPLSIPERYHYR